MRRIKKIFTYFFFIGMAIFAYRYFLDDRREIIFSAPKNVTVNDNGLYFLTATPTATVAEFLTENNITVDQYDLVMPPSETPVYPGTFIEIRRAVKIRIEADGQKKEFHTLARTVSEALLDSQTFLGEDDLIEPLPQALLMPDTQIVITRVDIREETVEKPVDFEIIVKEDDSLSWRIKKIKEPGTKGTKEIKYKVVSHDGKEISRKILAERTLKEPVPEVVVQGTYMKLGKTAKGQGTWYAFKGGLFAASTSLPRGSFAKVTNTENGKSVIVQINDYGPFGKGRIIDLDKVAFQKIASLGAGVIGVKVEQILN